MNTNISQEQKNRELVLREYITNNTFDKNLLDFFDLEIFNVTNNSKNMLPNLAKIFKYSALDNSIILSNEQIKCLNMLESNNLLISAPTSFGKTFIALEYIKRKQNKLSTIAFIVPTIALMNELFSKIYKFFGEDYEIILNDSDIELLPEQRVIFILVPERMMSAKIQKVLQNRKLDLMVYDEVYKLSGNTEKDSRIVLMNYVFKNLTESASKIILLGPYINSVKNLQNDIQIFKTDFSPILNTIYFNPNYNFSYSNNERQLIYFKSPSKIFKFIENLELNFESNNNLEIVNWISSNVYENWIYAKLLKFGIGIHHGKTPLYLRKYIEDEFNYGNQIHTILCTSTLMEGINTPSSKLIIMDIPDTSFQLNNLIGRIGRLSIDKPLIGNIVFTCNEDVVRLDQSKWIDIEFILSSEIEAKSMDEYLYLEKEDESKLMEDYKNYTNILNEMGIYTTDIMLLGLKFNYFKNIIDNGYLGEIKKILLEEKYTKDLIKKFVKIIGDPSHIQHRYFQTKQYISVDRDRDYLPFYNTIYLIMLHGIRNTIKYFINTFSTNESDINKYIDGILELNNYIHFQFANVIGIIELISPLFSDEEVKRLNDFSHMISNYVDNNSMISKALEDFGIPREDFLPIRKKLKEMQIDTKGLSSSQLKKSINSIDSNIPDISPFTKKLLNRGR